MRHCEAVDHHDLLGTHRAAPQAHAVAIALPKRDPVKEVQIMSEGLNQVAPVERSRAAIVAADGTCFEACLVAPRGGTGPALLILHGAAGLDASAVAWCKRFADEGYAVLAPDLSRHFDGHAFALTAALADVAAARPALSPHLMAGARCAAVGFGAGASVGLRLAAHGAIDALAVYEPPAVVDEDGAIACPVTAHLAEIALRRCAPRSSGSPQAMRAATSISMTACRPASPTPLSRASTGMPRRSLTRARSRPSDRRSDPITTWHGFSGST
jgi:dienelactone hydrolase